MKIHFWAGDFTPGRVRKFACGRTLDVELKEVDDLNEFKKIPIKDLCIGCRKSLARIF
jgi:hypothetical protein